MTENTNALIHILLFFGTVGLMLFNFCCFIRLLDEKFSLKELLGEMNPFIMIIRHPIGLIIIPAVFWLVHAMMSSNLYDYLSKRTDLNLTLISALILFIFIVYTLIWSANLMVENSDEINAVGKKVEDGIVKLAKRILTSSFVALFVSGVTYASGFNSGITLFSASIGGIIFFTVSLFSS